MKTNYHTHIYRCGHAEGDVEDYIREAIENNYEIIGISDHGPLPDYLFDRMAMEELEDYFESILQAKEKYGDKIKILSALELEYFPEFEDYYEKLQNKFDYLILGVHWYMSKGKLFASSNVTNREEIEVYREKTIEAMESGYFSFVAHPDVFMLAYPKWDDYCINISKAICEKAKELDIPLELNGNGVRRGLQTKPEGQRYSYPREEFWKIASEVGVKVLVNSDCHLVKDLDDESLKLARKLAEDWNLKIINEF